MAGEGEGKRTWKLSIGEGGGECSASYPPFGENSSNICNTMYPWTRDSLFSFSFIFSIETFDLEEEREFHLPII